MKNIHVLPTDKPSRLHYDHTGFFLSKNYQDSKTINSIVKGKNIYITSNEEIKEGDWVIQVNFEKTTTQLIQCVTDAQVAIANNKNKSFTKSKIILTTDLELQKDGVQAIDDEFLEWFVKNPSCEWVRVNDLYNYTNESTQHIGYKIIIPKEESKKIFDLPIATNLGNALTETMKSVSQHERGIKQGEINLFNFKKEVIKTEEDAKIFVETMENIPEPNDKLKKAFKDFNKQETLEYGLLQHIKTCLECNNESQAIRLLEKYGFEKQEGRYSEEEVLDILNEYRKLYGREDAYKSQLSYFIEQFKKK